MSRRIDRLSAQLKRELAALIRKKVKDPRVGIVTVHHVSVTRDLTHAKVFVRVPGEPDEVKAAMEGLEAAAPFLRGQLGSVLKIRRAPELVFQEDESLDKALRIEALLDEVRPEGGWETREEGTDPAADAQGPDGVGDPDDTGA